MDTLGLSTPYKVWQCSQCQGDTEFYCNTCKRDLCLQCKEKHVIDLHTKHHDVVIYREKFEHLQKQEPALLYDARKQQVENEQLELMSTPVLHTSVCVTGVSHGVLHISRVMSDRVWVSDDYNLILTDTTGDTIHRVTDITWYGGGHTVNSSGELIYIDRKRNINKLSTDNKTVTRLIQRTSPWEPVCVYCSPSTGDLMVGMYNYKTGKVTRYNSSGQHILTIEHDHTGHTLYSYPLFITENNNGDIIVSHWNNYNRGAVVVTERGGRHRFSYTGPPSGSSLDPLGICTDALSHILVCDHNTYTVQMIDKDGHFLSLLLTQQHGINRPRSLNYDDKTHLLWVGSFNTNTVSVYRYLQRRYSLNDDSVDDEKRIFKSTDDKNILEDTSEKTELELRLSPTGKEKKDKTPLSAKIIPDFLPPFIKPTSTALEKKLLVSDAFLTSRFKPSIHSSLPVSDYRSPFRGIGPLEEWRRISQKHRGIHRNKPLIYSSIPDDSVDDEKRIFKSTDDTNILEDTRKKTELKLMLSRTGKEKKDKIPISADIIPGKKRKFWNLQSPMENEDPGPSASKLKILGEANLDSAVTDVVLLSEHENTSSGDDMSVDGKMSSEEIKPLKGTSKYGSWSTNKPAIRSHGKRLPHYSSRLGKTQKAKKKRKTKKYSYIMTEEMITFNKKLEQLRENAEADIRIHALVNSLNIETKFRRLWRSEPINQAYGEFICNLDYLDCVGLGVGITMKPFNQYIQPFYGRRVNDFLGWMKDCVKVLGKTRSTQWGSVSSILFAIYAKEAILEFKPKELAEILDYSMRCAMENENYLLVFEIVRIYIFDHVIQLQRIFKDTKGVSPLIIDIILQTSRKMILRKFPNLQNNAIVLSFCWECGQGILTRMVLIMSYKGSIEITDSIPDEVMGFKLVLHNLAHLSDEASQVFKSIPVSKKIPLPTVTESEARELFSKHSNLTMISASPYKSVGYSKGKHIVVEKLCISLFCLHKGYIPYGEEQFPKKIRDVEVDVQEGYCYFGAGRSLELGGHIKRLGSGSIGGFVYLPNNKVGLITCAHVVFSSEEMMNGQLTDTSQIEVEAFDKRHHSYKVCGKCKCAKFPQYNMIGQPVSKPDPSVDAALIELDQDIDTFEFKAGISEQLQSAGFDPSNPPVFFGEVVPLPDPVPVHRLIERIPNNSDIVVKYVTATGTVIGQDYLSNTTSGEVTSLSDPDPVFKVSGSIPNKLDSVVKYGAVTGFTIGNLYHSPVHVRFVQENLNLPGNLHSAVMCDQIEIQNLPQGQFFKVGDSGSFVFCINPDKTLSCLGMAVGLSTRESCLVTPIGRILDNLCPGARLKSCGSSGTSSLHSSNTHLKQQSSDTVSSHAALQSILGEMMITMQSNFHASLQDVQRNIETNFQSSLQNVERNFQVSLQNVQREVQTLQSQVKQTEDSKTQSSSNQSSANQN
ncbi:uncharacterized protein LOC125666144 isoform X2 [Ostrea edulis]|uniref:uncharacterized protein LOC125666144 isoform X2 n=1 Tax=Ostrea edulis TaxID=37623 RepID=UPI0024AECFD0|nr:uncharacterized protein LOC125666144 isoform X2 [Ostrea edulis]